jgi:hypothetical protein
VSLHEVAARLAAGRGDAETVTAKDRRRVRLALHHRHLPLLEEAGLVSHDPASGRIALASLSPPAREALRTATCAARLTPGAALADDQLTNQENGGSDPGKETG